MCKFSRYFGLFLAGTLFNCLCCCTQRMGHGSFLEEKTDIVHKSGRVQSGDDQHQYVMNLKNYDWALELRNMLCIVRSQFIFIFKNTNSRVSTVIFKQ